MSCFKAVQYRDYYGCEVGRIVFLNQTMSFDNPLTNKIANFLIEIGLDVIPAQLEDETFLPGILVQNGKLLVDETKLKYPGDLLHEAGHLAMTPFALRREMSDEVNLPDVNMNAIESQSIAWSYAACLHLGLDPRVVFHKDGYKGHSENLLLNFSLGIYIGVNGLEEAGMTASDKLAQEIGVKPYPHMLKWLRD